MSSLGTARTCPLASIAIASIPASVRFAVQKGRAAARGIQDLQFARDDYYLPPEFAAPRRFFATTGLSVTRDG